MTEALKEAIRTRQAILFVGAGVSMDLGLPSWANLVAKIGEELDYDPDVFQQHGNYLELAEYYELQKSSLGPLRSWMDREWHKNHSRVDKSAIHQLILELNFPVIYTTNYDRWLEILLERNRREYTKVATIGDLAQIREGTTQVVKFHGDFDDDESLVLTETSYFERLDLESPLDIKLRADSIGKSVLFIGYGVSDINIRYLLYKLYKNWRESRFERARPKSYIFLTRPNPVQEAILERRGIIPVVSQLDDPGAGLEHFLRQLLPQAGT